jgi:hypothetical protein
VATVCHTPIQGTTLRVTRLDLCGAVVTGACGTATSDGFISVQMSDDVDTDDEYVLVHRPGTCVHRRVRPLLNRIDVELTLCSVDPGLLNVVSASPVVTDHLGDSVGFASDDDEYASASFALEVWTNIAGSEGCAEDGTRRYGYLLLPWVGDGVIGDMDVENAPLSLTISAATVLGNSWGTGPYDVVHDGAGSPSPLPAELPVTRQRHWQVTTLAPPEPTCGCTTLTP